jgi:Uma2 family endonuclease
MGTITKISFEEFQKLQDAADETVRYELDEGELIVTPSPAAWHNIVYLRLWRALDAFVRSHRLGVVLTEVDFRLSSNTIRKPDVAFITRDQLKKFDLYKTPISGAPSLAVEVISPSNLAQDTAKKVRQYLTAGSHAVWVIYPALNAIEIHNRDGSRKITINDRFAETRPFPGCEFTLSLAELFDQDPEK